MLYLLDSNILLYSKMQDSPEYQHTSGWLTAALADPNNTIVVCETSILAFLRVGTNPRLFDPPLPIKEAREFLECMLLRPNVQIFQPSFSVYSELLDKMEILNLRGDITMDAHLATIAVRVGATLVTRDRDFAKFSYLKVINPVDNKSST